MSNANEKINQLERISELEKENAGLMTIQNIECERHQVELSELKAEIEGLKQLLGAILHYPECWDTAAYPDMEKAALEVAAWGTTTCSNPDCPKKAPVAPDWHDIKQHVQEESKKYQKPVNISNVINEAILKERNAVAPTCPQNPKSEPVLEALPGIKRVTGGRGKATAAEKRLMANFYLVYEDRSSLFIHGVENHRKMQVVAVDEGFVIYSGKNCTIWQENDPDPNDLDDEEDAYEDDQAMETHDEAGDE